MLGIGKNFIYNMIYQVSLVIIPLITAPYLSRTLGPTASGEYSYAYSVAYYFVIISILGINNYGNRNIAAVRENKTDLNYTFSKIYYLQIITSSVALFIYVIYCVFLNSNNYALAYVEIIFVASAMFDINWLYFGLEEFKITVVRRTAIKVITAVLIFILVHSKEDLIVYSIIIAASEMIGQLYLWFNLPKYVKFVKVPNKEIRSSVGRVIILFIPIIATSIYRYMDKIMLGILSNMSNVGQYEYAGKIIMVGLGSMTALGTVMLPRMSNLIAHNRTSEMKRYLSISMQFAMFIACAISFGLAGVAERLAIVYFGSEYVICGMVMYYLSPTVLAIAWANVIRTQYLIPSAHDKEYVISVIIGAFLNFSLNFILIPIMGINGAIIGTISAEFIVAIIQTLLVRKKLDIKKYLLQGIPFVLSGVIMFASVRIGGKLTENNISGLLIQITIGILIYLLLSGLYCYYSKNEVYTIVLNSFKKIRK